MRLKIDPDDDGLTFYRKGSEGPSTPYQHTDSRGWWKFFTFPHSEDLSEGLALSV